MLTIADPYLARQPRGGLSHDAVRARSGIDLVLVTADDQKADCSGVAPPAGAVAACRASHTGPFLKPHLCG